MSVTDQQIRELQAKALEAKDWLLVGDCKRALDPWSGTRVAAKYDRDDARARCAVIINTKLCKHCGKFVDEHRVYFGVAGPFCNVQCREGYIES